jgi:hypothetical protein
MVTRRDEETVFRSAIEWPHMRRREEFDIGPGPMPMKLGEAVQAAVVTIAETAIINPYCESPIEAIFGAQLKSSCSKHSRTSSSCVARKASTGGMDRTACC